MSWLSDVVVRLDLRGSVRFGPNGCQAARRRRVDELPNEQVLVIQPAKRAFPYNEAREKTRPVWSLFTPCALMNSLLEPVAAAAKQATPGDVVVLSSACLSFDQFRNYQHRGEVFRQAVGSIGGGEPRRSPLYVWQ